MFGIEHGYYTFAGGQHDTSGRHQCDVSLRSSTTQNHRSTTDANSRAPGMATKLDADRPKLHGDGLFLKTLTAYDKDTRSRRQTAKRGTKPRDAPKRSTLR